MADLKIQPSKVSKTQAKTDVVAPEVPQAVRLKALTDQVDAALGNFILSPEEAGKLKTALDQDPALRAEVAEHLKAKLESSAKPVGITPIGMSTLTKAVGVDLKALFFVRQAQSSVAQHKLGEGLTKNAPTTADGHDVEKQKAGSDNLLDKQKKVRDGQNGVIDRPIGGSKGAAYDAGMIVVDDLKQKLENKLDASLPVEGKAVKDALREPIRKGANAVISEVTKDPATMKSLGDVVSNVGKPEFMASVSDAASKVGDKIVSTTGITAVNVDAVESLISGLGSGLTKLEKAAKSLGNPKINAAITEHGPKLLKNVTEFGAKLTKGAKDSKVVVDVVKGGAEVASSGAKIAGQSVPGVGQALGVVTTGMAAAEFIGDCRHKPRDWLRIGASFLNTIGQGVGVVIPFVGAASTGLKLAADAGMNAHDKKLGKEKYAASSLKDVAPVLNDATKMLTPFLEGAGYDDVAAKLTAYNGTLAAVADSGMTAADFEKLSADEREALMAQFAACASEASKLETEAKGTPHEAAARLMGEGFRTIMSVLRKSKNVANSPNVEAETKKLQGEAMEAANKAAAASALIDQIEKKPKA